MVINDLSNPFYVELAIGIEQACQGGRLYPVSRQHRRKPGPPATSDPLDARARRRRACARPGDWFLGRRIEGPPRGMPVVQVMRRLPGLKASIVSPENKEGARKATAHLLAAGHTRVAFVGGLKSMIVRDERLAGYSLALRGSRSSVRGIAGHRDDDQLLGRRGGGPAVAQPARACDRRPLLQRRRRDRACPRLTEAGVSVGREFAVIGFDDIEEAKHTLPALSSVAVNGRNLGSRAAQLLMRQLASGDFEPETVLSPTTLVVRASCGASNANQMEARA